MFKKLDYKKKNIVLAGVMLIFIYIAWSFSFKNTFAAIYLNHTLKQEQAVDEVMDSAFPVLTRKHNFYKTVIKSYKINAEDNEGRLWQSLSGVAISNGLEISFEPAPVAEKDTLLTNLHVVNQSFNFKGNYFQMVKLLDSINKTPGIGRPSGFQLREDKKQGDESTGKLMLKLELSGVASIRLPAPFSEGERIQE